jgi:hypothetical protein
VLLKGNNSGLEAGYDVSESRGIRGSHKRALNRRDIRSSLVNRYGRPQTSDHVKNLDVLARHARVLGQVKWHQHLRACATVRKHKRCRQNADHFIFVTIQSDLGADYRTVRSKPPLPDFIRKRDNGSRFRGIFIAAKRPPRRRLDSEQREQGCCHTRIVNSLRAESSGEIEIAFVLCCEFRETVVLASPLQEIGRSDDSGFPPRHVVGQPN